MSGGFLNALLGGLTGAGKGIAQQQQFRSQEADADLDRKLKGFQLAALESKPAVKWTWDTKRKVFTSENGETREVPGIKPQWDDPEKPEAPHTINTKNGIFQLNATTRQWEPAKDPTGQPLMPDRAEPQSSFSFPVVTDENGRQVLARANARTGEVAPTQIGAKPTGSAAKLTGDQEKSYLFYNLMKNAEPEITKSLGSGRIRPSAVSAYLGANAVGDIPVVGKAIGAIAKPAANANLNADEQQMIRAGKDFAAGVLRKESGAAVTNSELMEVMERYFPGMFGDKPDLTEAKNRARLQYMQTMEQEAGPAIQFYGRQHPTTPPAPYSSNNPFAPRR
jgi:hypothetical protein